MEPVLDRTGVRAPTAGEVIIAPNVGLMKLPNSVVVVVIHRLFSYICPAAVCDPSCLHGVCSSPYHCNCSSGYSGNACDIRMRPHV